MDDPKFFANGVMGDDHSMITRVWVLPFLAVKTLSLIDYINYIIIMIIVVINVTGGPGPPNFLSPWKSLTGQACTVAGVCP